MAVPVPSGASIAVIGAGIIGTSAAFALAERGYAVTLIDRDEPGKTGASWGNAGHVVGSAIFPLSTPGIVGEALKMLGDPDGALKLRLPHLPALAPWLWRFWRSSSGRAYERAIAGLTEINAGAVEATEALMARAGMAQKFRWAPALYLYESDASFEADRPHWRQRAEIGLASSEVTGTQVTEMEPSLARVFPHGVLSHKWGIVSDPFEVVQGYFAAARRLGAGYERLSVQSLRDDGDGVVLGTDTGERQFDAALVTAGVWSKPQARSLGENLPVEAERGYNLTFPHAPARLNRPLVFADRGVVATQLGPGLRLGGWTELGGTELPPDPRHWDAMRRIAEAVLPGLKAAPAKEWMGHRPSMPDSVPAISRSGRSDRVFYAVGHGHYGLSFAARTAEVLGEMIGDGAEFPAFSIRRFN